MEKELYKWQEECLERWFDNRGRGMVQAITGSGKTRLALEAINRLDKKLGGRLRVKIVVPGGTLMRQWKRVLQEYLDQSESGDLSRDVIRQSIGLRGGGFCADPNHKYMIYVINSARYELARQILTELKQGEDVLLIADECHHYESGQNRLIFEFLPYIKEQEAHFFSLGLSAALPVGTTQAFLASVLGRKIYHYSIKEASSEQVICPYDIWHISLNLGDEERHEYDEISERMTALWQKLRKGYPALDNMGIKERFELLRGLAGEKDKKISKVAALYMNLTFVRKRLVCLASSRISCVCQLVRLLDTQEKIIIFGERTDQADELYGLLRKEYQEKVGRCHSKMGIQANKITLEGFRTGNIRILIACKTADEGLDVPDVGIGIILSGTANWRQRVQRLGRIIRKSDTKSRAALYYLHIEDTSEDSCYLPGEGVHCLFELTYDPRKQWFGNGEYDEKAGVLLEELQNAGESDAKLQEAVICLQMGCIRTDWMLDTEDIKKKIRDAGSVRERNYWVCMKRLKSY